MRRLGSIDSKDGNLLLERLSALERGAVAAVVETVELGPGELLCGAGAKLRHVYFPRHGVVSLFAEVANGPAVGVGMVRGDGMFGLGAAVGEKTSHLRATAQGPGAGDRIEAVAFRRVLGACPGFRSLLFAHAQTVATQMSQNTACNAVHPALVRVARWMLDVAEGSGGVRFSATQAAIGEALGLQRPAVSNAAAELQRAGHIHYLRGKVSILDPAGLRAMACRCSIRRTARAV